MVKRIAKIMRVDITDPRTVNYASFYEIAIKATKSHEVLRQLNREVDIDDWIAAKLDRLEATRL